MIVCSDFLLIYADHPDFSVLFHSFICYCISLTPHSLVSYRMFWVKSFERRIDPQKSCTQIDIFRQHTFLIDSIDL